MPVLCTCPEGHQWRNPGEAADHAPVCPECGQPAAATVVEPAIPPSVPEAPLADLAEEEVLPVVRAAPRPTRPAPKEPPRGRPAPPRPAARSGGYGCLIALLIGALGLLLLMMTGAGVLFFVWQQSEDRRRREQNMRQQAEANARQAAQQQEVARAAAADAERALRLAEQEQRRAAVQAQDELQRLRFEADQLRAKAAELGKGREFDKLLALAEERQRQAEKELAAANLALQAAERDRQRAMQDLRAAEAKLAGEAGKDREARQKAEAALYARSVALADWELRAGRREMADRALADCPAELRQWEWYYLWGQARRFPTHYNPDGGIMTALALSPDGKRVATVGPLETRVRVWEADGFKVVSLTDPQGDHVYTLAFHPEGKLVAAAGARPPGAPGRVQLIDVDAGKVLRTFASRGDASLKRPTSVAFNPDGKLLVVGDVAGNLAAWDADGKWLWTVKAHPVQVHRVAFSADGKRLATAAAITLKKAPAVAEVALWDPADGKKLAVLEERRPVLDLSFNPTGRLLATASIDGSLKLWDVSDPKDELKPIRTFSIGHGALSAAGFVPDGWHLYTVAKDGELTIHDTPTGRTLETMRSYQKDAVGARVARGGERVVVYGRKAGGAEVWTLTPKKPAPPVGSHPGGVTALAFTPDGQRLASAGEDGSIKVWDALKRAEVLSLKGHGRPASRLAFSRDGTLLASAAAGKDGKPAEVKVWDAAAGREVSGFTESAPEPLSLVFSPDGKRVGLTGPGGKVAFRDAQTGKPAERLEDASASTLRAGQEVACLAVSPDGLSLARANQDVMQVESISPDGGPQGWVAKAQVKTGQFTGLVWSPDSKRLAALVDGTLLGVRDLAGNIEVFLFRGAGLDAGKVAFNHDGTRLVTAGGDGTVQLWDVAGKQEILALRPQRGALAAVAVSPDGSRIAAGAADGSVLLWSAPPGTKVRVDK